MVRDGGTYVVDVPRSQMNTLITLANSCSLRSSTVFLLILRLKSKRGCCLFYCGMSCLNLLHFLSSSNANLKKTFINEFEVYFVNYRK